MGQKPKRDSHENAAETDGWLREAESPRDVRKTLKFPQTVEDLSQRQMSPDSPGKVALARIAKWEFRRRAVGPFRRGQLENRKPSQDLGFVSVPGFNAVT